MWKNIIRQSRVFAVQSYRIKKSNCEKSVWNVCFLLHLHGILEILEIILKHRSIVISFLKICYFRCWIRIKSYVLLAHIIQFGTQNVKLRLWNILEALSVHVILHNVFKIFNAFMLEFHVFMTQEFLLVDFHHSQSKLEMKCHFTHRSSKILLCVSTV